MKISNESAAKIKAGGETVEPGEAKTVMVPSTGIASVAAEIQSRADAQLLVAEARSARMKEMWRKRRAKAEAGGKP